MSKPILSELEYNASDVASAILENAELSVTNQDFAVSDRASIFVTATGWNLDNHNFYSFNGFMFCSGRFYKATDPSNGETVCNINDSGLYPNSLYAFPSISHEGDYMQRLEFDTDGSLAVVNPVNQGGDYFYITFNGWYRFT